MDEMRWLKAESREIVECVIGALVWHEDNVEDCTCADNDGVCWYHLTADEQQEARIAHAVKELGELRQH